MILRNRATIQKALGREDDDMMEIVTAIETDNIINSIMIIGTMHITSDAEGLDDFETITSGTETFRSQIATLVKYFFLCKPLSDCPRRGVGTT